MLRPYLLANCSIPFNLARIAEHYYSRANLSAAFFAAAITCALTDPVIPGKVFMLYVEFMALGFACSSFDRRWPLIATLALVIVLSALVAIPLSAMAEGRVIAPTTFYAMMVLSLAPLMFVRNVTRIFYCLIPAFYLQAAVSWIQWFWYEASRVGGVSLNINAGSSFLLIGAIFLASQPKLRWLSVPLIATLPLSGSRWVAVVAIIILGGMYLSRHVKWRYLLVGMAIASVVAVTPQYGQVMEAYRARESSMPAMAHATYSANARLAHTGSIIAPEVLIPRGKEMPDSPIHNVPLRMAMEIGLMAAVAWIAMSLIALWKKPKNSGHWWMMAAIVMLSMMYNATWIAPIGAFWWLLVSPEFPSETS